MIDLSPLNRNPYVADILSQPAALRDTLAALADGGGPAFSSLAGRLASGQLRRVVLTGMGASYHALCPAWLQMMAAGLPVQMLETSELLHYAPALIASDTFVLAVSQSGKGVEMLQLIEAARGRATLAAVTNTPGSALAAAAEAVFVTPAGAEHSVACKTYASALAALVVIGQTLAGGPVAPLLTDLGDAPAAIAAYLAGWEARVDSAAAFLEGARSLILVGRGPSLAAAGNGALNIKEAALFPAEAMSAATFRHGPFELISETAPVLAFAGDERVAALNAKLYDDIRTGGGRAALAAPGSGPDAFSLPAVPEAALPLVEILAAQMTALALALLCKHTPGVFKHFSGVSPVPDPYAA